MRSNKNKLGRGISALLGEKKNKFVQHNNIQDNAENNICLDKDSDALVQNINLKQIIAGVYQPRQFFDKDKLQDLSESITKNGVIQPIIVRASDKNNKIFEIIAGERRFRASKMAGLSQIPAIVKDLSDAQALEFAIIENVQRSNLSPIEEANSYKRLMEEFKYTQAKVAEKLGKSRSYIANIIRLLSLPQEVQQMVQDGLISSSHARNLVGKENALELAQQIIDNDISVRQIENMDEEDILTQNDKFSQILSSEDLQRNELKKEYLKTLEDSISKMIGNLKVQASYNSKKQKGKVTIFYNDLDEVENLISQLEQ